MPLVYLQQRYAKKNPVKLKKLTNIFNEIFRKNASYDNIKVTKKQGLTPLENTYLEKPQEGVRMIRKTNSFNKNLMRIILFRTYEYLELCIILCIFCVLIYNNFLHLSKFTFFS